MPHASTRRSGVAALCLCLASLAVGAERPPAIATTVPRWHLPATDDLRPPRQRGLSLPRLTELAFGLDAERAVERFDRPPWVVISAQRRFATPRLLTDLDRTYQQVRRDFPFLGDARQPAVLLLFDGRPTADAFLRRIATELGLTLDLPRSFAALAFLGIGVLWTDELDPTTFHKVAIHEATHALTQQLFDIDRVPSWFAEGVAERAELVVHATDVTPVVRSLLAAGRVPPLRTLLDARHIPGHGYLPAALLIDWLLADPLRRSQLPQWFRDAQTQSTPNLLQLLERRMGLSADDLELAWTRWLNVRFGSPP
jgi:hypothetical protein